MAVDGILAVSWVELTNVAGTATGPTLTIAPFTKPKPLRVIGRGGALTSRLTGAAFGEMESRPGTGFITDSTMGLADPTVGVGLETTTWRNPPTTRSWAGIVTLNVVGFTTTLGRKFPLTVAVAPAMNPVPVKVIVKPAFPATKDAGTPACPVITGGALPMEKLTGAEMATPPGPAFTTVKAPVRATSN